MHILFLHDNALNESLALTELSAVLKKAGHRTDLLLTREERRLMPAIVAMRPDLICIAASLSNQAWAYELSRALAEAVQAPRIMAGGHPTFFPRHTLKHGRVHAAILGEAEGPFLRLLERLEAGASWRELSDIEGLASFREDGSFRIDASLKPFPLTTLPPADRGIYWARYRFMRLFPWKRFTTSRGCIHECAHCVNPAVNAMTGMPHLGVRKKKIETVLSEIQEARRMGPLRHIHFADDLFSANLPWLEQFAPSYRREIGIPFTCNSSVERFSEGVADALQEAGCSGIALALESGNEKIRRDVLQRPFSDDDYRRAIQRARRRGIEVLSFNMIGSPGERPADVRRTIALNRALGIRLQRVSLCTPVSKTALRRKAIELGWLAPEVPGTDDAGDEVELGTVSWRKGLIWDGPAAPRRDEIREMERLYDLFRLYARSKRLEMWLDPLFSHLPAGWLRPFQVFAALHERRFNRLRFRDAFRYALHVGSVNARTNVVPSLL